MNFKLEIIYNPGDVKTFEFDKKEILIGRAPENDLCINNAGISKLHAKIVQRQGQFELIDLESRNGTLLNGTKVTKEILSDNDEINIGGIQIRFFCSDLTMIYNPAFDNMAIDPDATIMLKNISFPVLVVMPDKKYPLIKEIFTIGRSDENDIVINDPRVSRFHAQIVTDNNNFYIKDIGSSNDTFVNGKKISNISLASGDIIKIGEVTITFFENDAEPDKFIKKTEIKSSIKEREPQRAEKEPVRIPQKKTILTVLLVLLILILSGYLFLNQKAPQLQEVTHVEINSPPKNIPDIKTALDLYIKGETGQSIHMLEELKQQENNTESATAGIYSSVIKDILKSFQNGESLYKEDTIREAFAEWKNIILLEKKLPLKQKSWYAVKISGFAADELYKQGFDSYKKGNQPDAVKNWKKALEIEPNHIKALTELENIASRLMDEGAKNDGKNSKILKWKEVLNTVPPDNPYYLKAQENLKN